MKRDEQGRRNRPPALPLRGIFSACLRRENFCQKILKKLLTFPQALRIIAPVLARGRNKKQKIAGLCKGSTTDSDSVCEGSNPSPAAKKKDMTEVMSFFLGSAARGRLHPSALECSGRRSRPFAEVLPAAKRSNAAKAARPRRAVGQDLRQLIQNFKYLDCSDLPKQKERLHPS